MTAGIVALIVGGITIKKILDALFPTQGDQLRAELEREAERLERVRRRYIDFLQMNADLFCRGKWWEIFTQRRESRKRAAELLRRVAALEVRLPEGSPNA